MVCPQSILWSCDGQGREGNDTDVIIATDGIQSFSNCITIQTTIWFISGPHFSTEATYFNFALIKDFIVYFITDKHGLFNH